MVVLLMTAAFLIDSGSAALAALGTVVFLVGLAVLGAVAVWLGYVGARFVIWPRLRATFDAISFAVQVTVLGWQRPALPD
jgi:hypothetical protein